MTHALGLYRGFPSQGVSPRLHQTVLRGQSRLARCLGPPVAALARPRPRNPRVPHAGQAKRRDHAPQSGLRSENGSTQGQPRGVRQYLQVHQYAHRERVGGQSKRRGREQRRSATVRDPGRPLCVRSRHAFVPGGLSSVVPLPDTPGLARSWIAHGFPVFPCPHQDQFVFRRSALADRWEQRHHPAEPAI